MICIKGLKTDIYQDVDLTEYGLTANGDGTYYPPSKKEYTILKKCVFVKFEATMSKDSEYIATIKINGTTYSHEDVSFSGYLEEPIVVYRFNGDLTVTKCQVLDAYDEDDVSDVHFYFPFSPTGETLEAATAEFKLLFDTPDTVLMPDINREFVIYDKYGVVGRFFVSSVLQETETSLSISAVDTVGYLETIDFNGYIAYKKGTGSNYSKVICSTIEDLCKEIFSKSEINCNIKLSEEQNQNVYGYIPKMTKKDALQYMCIGCGLKVETYRRDCPFIKSADEYDTYEIADENVFSSSAVSKNEEKKTAVKIRQTDYIGDTDATIFSYDLALNETGESLYTLTVGDVGSDVINPGSDCVEFQLCAPGVDKSGDTPGLWSSTKGVTVKSNTGVTAVIDAGNGSDGYSGHVDDDGVTWRRVVLKGVKIEDVYEKLDNDPWYITYGEGELLEVSDDATTVTWDTADDVAERFLKYYKASKTASVSFAMSGQERPGDCLKISFSGLYGDFEGRITSLDFDLTGDKIIAEAELYEVIKEE